MKRYCIYLLSITLLYVFFIGTSNFANAQSAAKALDYMTVIGDEYKEISKDQWDYTSAVAHGKSARKVDKRREELLQTNINARKKINKLPDFEGDGSYRDSVISYLTMSYNILNDDYAQIVDMEAVAEQSYDGMEAYLLARDLANQKLNTAQEMVQAQQANFAANHNINLIQDESKLAKKMAAANEMYKYYNVVYLIFFKSFKQESYLIEALGTKDVNAMEQNKRTLVKTSEEGLEKLKKCKDFKGDNSLKAVCIELMEFYKDEAEKFDVLIDFNLKNEKFEKMKAAFDAIKQSDRTQEDVDKFNSAVNELNEASGKYNILNNELNTNRGKLVNNWNKGADKFTDKHTP